MHVRREFGKRRTTMTLPHVPACSVLTRFLHFFCGRVCLHVPKMFLSSHSSPIRFSYARLPRAITSIFAHTLRVDSEPANSNNFAISLLFFVRVVRAATTHIAVCCVPLLRHDSGGYLTHSTTHARTFFACSIGARVPDHTFYDSMNGTHCRYIHIANVYLLALSCAYLYRYALLSHVLVTAGNACFIILTPLPHVPVTTRVYFSLSTCTFALSCANAKRMAVRQNNVLWTTCPHSM